MSLRTNNQGQVILTLDTQSLNEYLPYGEVLTLNLLTGLKGDPKAKTGERSTWIKGVQFVRMGRKKLRFWSATFGNRDVFGPSMESKYEKAARMLMPGTEDNASLRQQMDQVKRLKS